MFPLDDFSDAMKLKTILSSDIKSFFKIGYFGKYDIGSSKSNAPFLLSRGWIIVISIVAVYPG